MAKAKKAAGGGNVNADLVERLRPAMNLAVAKLQDPEVRLWLKENGEAVRDRVVAWRASRASIEIDAAPRRRMIEGVGEHFGQRKLERRVENLRLSVDSLGRGRPELAAELGPVVTLIDQFSASLAVASRLPVVKRKRAHLKLDRTLDELEEQLFEACLPAP